LSCNELCNIVQRIKELLSISLGSGTCQDNSNWNNGWTGAPNGKGLTCSEYVTGNYCKDGKVVPGAEWTLGATYNYPEKNCCECGKGSQGVGGGVSGGGKQWYSF
jgi:hypothetical protein